MRTVGRGMEGRSLHARKVGTLWTRFRARPLPESPDYSHGSGAAARRDHASRSSHMWSVQGPHSDNCPPPARPQRAQHEFAQEQRTERAHARPASPHCLGGTGCHPQQASPLPPARDKAGQEAGGRPQPSPNPWPPWEAAQVSTGSAGPGSPWFPGLGSPGSSPCAGHMAPCGDEALQAGKAGPMESRDGCPAQPALGLHHRSFPGSSKPLGPRSRQRAKLPTPPPFPERSIPGTAPASPQEARIIVIIT